MTKITWELALKTVSEANSQEHWTKKAKRHRQQQFFVRQLFNNLKNPVYLPCVVRLTRLGTRTLDCEENLPMAFKYIKDEIGACIFPEKVVVYFGKNGKVKQNKGHADSDPRVKWEYAQEKNKLQGIRIEIEPLAG